MPDTERVPRVFLSYRRGDSAFETTMIHDHLARAFGVENVFIDVDSIPIGGDFREVIGASVRKCDVLVAIIGKDWRGVGGDGAARIGSAQDFVRFEVETALTEKIPVVPLLLQAEMPRPEDLPPSLEPLVYRNAFALRAGRDLYPDLDRLVAALREIGNRIEPAPTPSEAPSGAPLETPSEAPVEPPSETTARASAPDPAPPRRREEQDQRPRTRAERSPAEVAPTAAAVTVTAFVALARTASELVYDFLSFDPVGAGDLTDVQSWPGPNLGATLQWSFVMGVMLGLVLWGLHRASARTGTAAWAVAIGGALGGFVIGKLTYDLPLELSGVVGYGALIGATYALGASLSLALSGRASTAAGLLATLLCTALFYSIVEIALFGGQNPLLTLLDGLMHGAIVCAALLIANALAPRSTHEP